MDFGLATFTLKPKEWVWGRRAPGRENSKCKDLNTGNRLSMLETQKEPRMAGM